MTDTLGTIGIADGTRTNKTSDCTLDWTQVRGVTYRVVVQYGGRREMVPLVGMKYSSI